MSLIESKFSVEVQPYIVELVKSPQAQKLDGGTSCLSLADGSVFIWVRKRPSRGLYIKHSYAPVVVEIYIKLLQES
jgi:hypothetical protein